MPSQDDLNDPGAQPTVTTPSAQHRAKTSATFSTDEIIAGRYRIVLFIAKGGMGEVYEAEDLDLGERVALKTVLPSIAEDRRIIERFKREIQLARKVTHRNVCRIFDLGHHETASGARVMFLTMELLRGETLAARLRKEPRLAVAEASEIVRQMAAALAAAHRVGIVHRDFKSSNVMLVPATEGGQETRVVVTDFGLARTAWGDEGPTATLTGTGDFLGTPAYMAPEQIEGHDVTAPADIYALGVVMYEMVTGVFPFTGDTPLAAAVRRLKVDPVSPRVHRPDLVPPWEGVILRCLARQPSERFATAEDVFRALQGEAVPAAPMDLGAESQRASRRRRAVRLAAVAVASLALWGTFWAIRPNLWKRLAPALSSQENGLPAPPAQVRRAIAVLGFQHASRDRESAWVGTALTEAFTAALAADGSLRTIPSDRAARMRLELSLPDAESLPKEVLERVRPYLGTDLAVLGAYYTIGDRAGGTLRLDVRLQDMQSGAVVAYFSENGSETAIPDLVSRVEARLRGALGLDARPRGGAGPQALPQGVEAMRSYAEGLDRLRHFDSAAARDLLQKAAAAEPSNPFIHAALAAAWKNLGEIEKAKGAIRQSVALAAGLTDEQRLRIEARSHELMDEWDAAAQAYRKLWELFPDDPDPGLALVPVQASQHKREESLATVAALRKIPGPAGADPRIDLAEARVTFDFQDNARALAAAEKAAAAGTAAGAGLLVAEARGLAASVLHALQRPDEAKASYQESISRYEAAGDHRNAGRVLGRFAVHLGGQGDISGARAAREKALAAYRAAADQAGIAGALGPIAGAHEREGNAAAARTLDEEALEIFRATGNRMGTAQVLSSLGRIFEEAWDLETARLYQEEAVAIYREFGQGDFAAWQVYFIGRILLKQGDLAGAKRRYEEAEAMIVRAAPTRNSGAIAEMLASIAEVLAETGDLAGARRTADQALGMVAEGGSREEIEGTTTTVIWVLILQGELSAARKHADEMLVQPRDTGNKGELSNIFGELSEIDRIEGDLKRSRRRFEDALKAAGLAVPDPEFSALMAELSLAEGRPADAVSLTAPAAASFRKQGRRIDEAGALATLAGAHLALRELGPARTAIDRALSLLEKSESRLTRIRVAITAARVRAASGDPGDGIEAAKSLEQALSDATAIGYAELGFQARLALGDLEIRSGRGAAGRARLEQLEREAVAKGFRLLARQAADARGAQSWSPAVSPR